MSWSGVKNQVNKSDIESWCEKMGIENYTINHKGEIDVDDSVRLANKDFKELPYKFGVVKGYFNLEGCKNLISLKNCPYFVGDSFVCDKCSKLESLEGCPTKVENHFWCKGCKRKFTMKEVRSLCEVDTRYLIFN